MKTEKVTLSRGKIYQIYSENKNLKLNKQQKKNTNMKNRVKNMSLYRKCGK